MNVPKNLLVSETSQAILLDLDQKSVGPQGLRGMRRVPEMGIVKPANVE